VIPIRYVAPNAITALSFSLALWAIISAGIGELEQAGWLIIWCVLLDILDGVVARALNAASTFGAQFDSFADLLAFGVAPAVLVLHFCWQAYTAADAWWIIAACGLYAIAAAVRLAVFNITPPDQHGWFKGIPTTVCGALLANGIILLTHYKEFAHSLNWPIYLCLTLVVLAIAMVSRLRFPKLTLPSDRFLKVFYLANIVGVYICGILRIAPEYLFCAALLLIASGLVKGIRSPGQR